MSVVMTRFTRPLALVALLTGPVLASIANSAMAQEPPVTGLPKTLQPATSQPPVSLVPAAPLTKAATTRPSTALPMNACARTRGTAENPLPPAPNCKWYNPEPVAKAPSPATDPASTAATTNTAASDTLKEDPAPTDTGLLVVEEETGIESGELNLVDIAGIGLLHEDQGLGRDLWQQGKRADILALLAQVQAPAHSSALQQGLRRILLTAAPWPALDPRDQVTTGDQIFGTDAISLRHMALGMIGENGAALRLSGDIPVAGRNDELQRIMTESRLIQGDLSLCNDLTDGDSMPEDGPDHFWQRLRILCLAKAGDSSNAEFLFGRLEEKGYNDTALLDAIFVLAGDESALEGLDNRDILSIATLIAANISVPAPAEGKRDEVSTALTILNGKAGTPDNRIIIAESLYTAGYPVAPLIRTLWQETEFDEKMLAHPRRALRDAPTDTVTAPHGLALLWQYVLRQQDPLNTVLALQDFWGMAHQQNQLGLAIHVAAPVLKALKPQPSVLGYGPDIVMGLVLTGQGKRALEWDGMARRFARSGDPVAITAVRRNWAPLMLLRDTPLPLEHQDIESWKMGFAVAEQPAGDATTANKLSPAEEFGPRILETVMMLNSLGHKPASDTWSSLAQTNVPATRTASLHPATSSIMRSKLAGASRGEALLGLYQTLGGSNPMTLSTTAFNDLLGLLQQAGAGKTARMLAVERFVSL